MDLDRLSSPSKYQKPHCLKKNEWKFHNAAAFELMLNTIKPKRKILGSPRVIADLRLLNEVFCSYQIHFGKGSVDSLWEVYSLPIEQKGSLVYEDSPGGKMAQFKQLPYVDLLGREFTQRTTEEGCSVILEKIQEADKEEDKVLCMWRVWEKAGPASLSSHPFRLCPGLPVQIGRYLFRPQYCSHLASRFSSNETYEITGCSLRG